MERKASRKWRLSRTKIIFKSCENRLINYLVHKKAQHRAQSKLEEPGEDTLVAVDDPTQSCVRFVEKDSFLVKDGCPLHGFPWPDVTLWILRLNNNFS
ncbi:hypothetical protein KIN20_013397 [Parelaphostrongylus tenuis]|uniref:Uncharacterized protein n=1 Tax=Parelaphostrongylus tenuis TaxID=148309 RepID=A0AAD5QNS8_PARTN|nr:hypothetical protein KIN20_013397 [Parelaphostrongylus tenuis]